MAPATSTVSSSCPFLNVPGEVRNRINELLAAGSHVWMPTPDHTHNHATSNPTSVDLSQAEAAPWQLAATCRQLKSEYLPILYGCSEIYIYNLNSAIFNASKFLKPEYAIRVKKICLIGEMNLSINFNNFPALQTVEYVADAVDWVPSGKDDIVDTIKATIDGKGLAEDRVEHTIAKSRLLTDLLATPGLTERVDIIVSIPLCVSLDSKYSYVVAMGEHGNYSKENVDVAFELRLEYITGGVVVNTLLTPTATLKQVEAKLLELNEGEESCNATIVAIAANQDADRWDDEQMDEWEEVVAEWREREGCAVAEAGREWVLAKMQ